MNLLLFTLFEGSLKFINQKGGVSRFVAVQQEETTDFIRVHLKRKQVRIFFYKLNL